MQLNINTVRAADVFPLMGVFGGVAVSVKGAFTVGWELSLPPVYYQDEDEYDDLIEAMASAARVLPAWSVIHRQDMFVYDTYKPVPGRAKTYLEKRFEAAHKGRRYLRHKAYLFISIGTAAMIEKDGKFSGLFGISGTIAPPTEEELDVFRAKAVEFITILTAGGRVGARLLDSEDEWLGTPGQPGIVQRYMMLGNASPLLSDISMGPDYVEAFDKRAQAYVLCESSRLPGVMPSVTRVDAMSSNGAQVFLSTGSAIGVHLGCEHCVNHIVVIPPQQQAVQRLERKKRDMTSSMRSNDNRLNAGEIDTYLDDVYTDSLMTVYAHLNIIAWGPSKEQTDISARLSAALSAMGSVDTIATRNRNNTPVLYYAGIPSNAFEIGKENLMTMELRSAFSMGIYETFDEGFGKGDLALCDRECMVPRLIDVDEVSAQMGLNNNYNKFVVGPSGSGKSFTVNRLLQCEYNAGATNFILDVGHSYEIPTSIVHEETGGRDGQYFTWSQDRPLKFNPFVGFTEWLDDKGLLRPDDTGVNALISILETIWQPEKGWTPSKEAILKQIIRDFTSAMLKAGRNESNRPVFNDLYDYIKDVVQKQFDERQTWKTNLETNTRKEHELLQKLDSLGDSKAKDKQAERARLEKQLASTREALIEKGFSVGTDKVGYENLDIIDFHIALEAYSIQGTFATLLNEPNPADVFLSRWTVFELDLLSQVKDKVFYSLVVLMIMHAFDMKMRSVEGRKVLCIDEAWKAIANKTMAPYMRSLWKTARKFSTAAMVITQELEDITSSEVIKDSILANSDIEIILDQSKNANILTDDSRSDDPNDIRKILGLTKKDVNLILSMNKGVNPAYNYREIFIKYINGRSTVMAVEASPQETKAYESKFSRKAPTIALAKELGSWRRAIDQITGFDSSTLEL